MRRAESASSHLEREEFARRQAEMTAAWMRNVSEGAEDVQAYIETRKAAYLGRWREAARFLAPGAKVLDIGGGNLWPELLRFIKARGLNYWYLDVDPECVAGCRSLAVSEGLDPSRFEVGFNDRLPFPQGGFDAVFSSHCVEHSFNLQATFDELWRVIRPGGFLLMAVPLGWEANPEHPYFLGPDEWIALTEDSGFDVRAAQVGKEYPESGYDLFIAARRIERPADPWRIRAEDYRKTSYVFAPFDDPAISFSTPTTVGLDHVLCHEEGWSIRIEPPASAKVALPIFARHPWSGLVEAAGGGATSYADLYSWFPFAQPLRVQVGGDGGRAPVVEIRAVGRNAVSRGAQGALYGVMFA